MNQILFLLALQIFGASIAFAQWPEPERFGDGEIPYAYILRDALWDWPEGSQKIIGVCWEERDSSFEPEYRLVEEAITDSWQASSGLIFVGWDRACDENMPGIHIRVADAGPHVKRLGKYLNRKTDGMILNFTFNSWSRKCRSMRDACIRQIAMHEFGHAIGFAHEQNRPDTPRGNEPGECWRAPQGPSGNVELTDYDPLSIMNYCNPDPYGEQTLSESDKIAVASLYPKE